MTNIALRSLRQMASDKYNEIKTGNYVDVYSDRLDDVMKDILEDALYRAYELKGKDR